MDLILIFHCGSLPFPLIRRLITEDSTVFLRHKNSRISKLVLGVSWRMGICFKKWPRSQNYVSFAVSGVQKRAPPVLNKDSLQKHIGIFLELKKRFLASLHLFVSNFYSLLAFKSPMQD